MKHSFCGLMPFGLFLGMAGQAIHRMQERLRQVVGIDRSNSC
jgi:hypothetical protein